MLTSLRRTFILINPVSFFSLQLDFTMDATSSGELPRLFLISSSSIWARKGSRGGRGLVGHVDILVRMGTKRDVFRQQDWTSSLSLVSGWRKDSPSRSLPLMSSLESHSEHNPETSKVSLGCFSSPFLFRDAMPRTPKATRKKPTCTDTENALWRMQLSPVVCKQMHQLPFPRTLEELEGPAQRFHDAHGEKWLGHWQGLLLSFIIVYNVFEATHSANLEVVWQHLFGKPHKTHKFCAIFSSNVCRVFT